MSPKNARIVMRDKNPNVIMKRETASFFFPSRYQRSGLPKTSDPVTAADSTKRSSIAIGISIMSFNTRKCDAEKKSDATNVM